jgi:hypothetical protein
MNELKAVARLLAQERGEALCFTRERPYPLSDSPMVMVPIVMAGESPSLFALGIGDGVRAWRLHVCTEPRNRDQQYAMLGEAAQHMEMFLGAWETNKELMPQLLTSSGDASRVCLLTVHRMTYAPQPGLRSVGRRLHWLDRVFEQPDSAALVNMPWAICELFATGQDDRADSHLGAVLEWLKPADGQIYNRLLRAEECPTSTSTAPRLDNEKLMPLVEALGRATESHTSTTARLRTEIEQILADEVSRRYQLIEIALTKCRAFPSSAAADHIQHRDRTRYDRNLAYVANPENLLAAGLSGHAATDEFLSRELNAEYLQQVMLRSVSSSRSSARLSGDILAGRVVRRDIQKKGRKTTIQYQIRSNQERLAMRRGDSTTLLDDEAFEFSVVDFNLDPSGDTTVTLELTSGKTKPGQPDVGDYIELAEPISSPERIARTMCIARDRLRRKPALRTNNARRAASEDYLSGIKRLRRKG